MTAVLGLILACSSGPEGGGSATGGAGGIGGSGGLGGRGGGTGEPCELTDRWEVVGSWGDGTFAYSHVVLVQSPIDESVWQVVSRSYRDAERDYDDIALLRSLDRGESWVQAQRWQFPEGRRGLSSGAVMAEDGTLYVLVREYALVDGRHADRLVKLLRYPPGGALLEVGAFRPDGSTDTRSNGIVARGDEVWFIAFDATPYPPDYHMVRYANGALESMDIIRYRTPSNEVYVRDLVVSPSGAIWAAGSGFDADMGIWHATMWEGDEEGFSLIADTQRMFGVDESDTIMALTFEGAERCWFSYYTIHDGQYRWRGGYADIADPESSFTLNDEFSYLESKASLTARVATHPSGAVFMGGYALDEQDWQWGIVRKGKTEGFELSDEFVRGGDGSHRSDVTSMLTDRQGDVWVAYMSRPATAWYPQFTTLKRMACVMQD